MLFQKSLQSSWTAGASLQDFPAGFLLTVFLVNVLALLNFCALTVAMITISQSLHAPDSVAILLPTAFYAAMACVVPATPFLLRHWNTRRLLVTAILGLAATTALAAICTNFWQLAAVLFMHGLAGAPVAAATQAAVSNLLPGPERGIGMAVWGGGIYAGGIIGPLHADVLLDTLGWQALFLAPLPLALVVLPLVLKYVPPLPRVRAPADAASLLLAPLTIFLLVMTVTLGPNQGWLRSPMVTATLVAACVALPVYLIAYRATPAPAFHLGCLRDRHAALALLLVFFVNMLGTGLFQIEFLGKLSRLSPELLSLRAISGTAALLAGMAIAGWLCHSGRAGIALLSGWTLTVIAKVGFLFYDSHTDAFLALGPPMAGGVGFGLITAALATFAYRTVPEVHAADVATLFVLASYLGTSLGVGVLDEVVVAVASVDLAEGMSVAVAERVAFKAEFQVELFATLPLLLPVLLLGREVAGKLPLLRS